MKLYFPKIKGATGIQNWGSPWGTVLSLEPGETTPELTDQEIVMLKSACPFLEEVDKPESDKVVKPGLPFTEVPEVLPEERSLLLKLCKSLGIKTINTMKNVDLVASIQKLKEERING